MKFSESWLREWIDPSINNNELINQLTMAGFQVEKSKPVSNNCFKNVIIGEIINYKIHPNVNNLWLITVNIGHKKRIKIVCEKNFNYYKNLRVVVAKVGTILPNGRIVNSVIVNGEISEGFLCTFSMLQFNDYQKDIIVLPNHAPIGHDFYDYLNFSDNIIDINIPYNRGDCFNIIGLAREVAAINQLKLKKIKEKKIKSSIINTIPIFIENYEQCPKFLGRIVKNINVSISTPLNIKEKLHRCGIESVNVIIDITNYVLLELGYPIQVFDYDQIHQKAIYVRYSKHGEKLLLSNQQINLNLFKNTLIISDSHKPLSIAGITVGSQSRITTKTRNIFLQSAFYNPHNILKQAKLYNLNTIVTLHYERGIDYNLSKLALNYVTSLLLKVCRGQAGPIISAINYDYLPKSHLIILNQSKLDSVLGFHIKKSEVTRILKNLGFQLKLQNNFWKVLTPTWRSDILLEENLIAEIIRIYGYNKIPQVSMKISSTKPYFRKNKISLSRTKTILIDRGYQEIITYSFINNKIQKLLFPKNLSLALKNPINSDMSTMRLSLWPGLISTVKYNLNRQQKHIQFFENGICFVPKINDNNQVSQQLMIAGIRTGLKCESNWNTETSPVDFYDIKGDVEAILNIMNKYNNQITFKHYKQSALHPSKSAAIYFNKELIGYIGMIHPLIQKQLDLQSNIFVFELSWDTISKFELPIKIMNISKFPKNHRDISLIVPYHISSAEVINSCKNLNIPQLETIKLLDMYEGRNIPKGYKSFTIELTLQSKQHTLKEEEILKITDTCCKILKKKYNAILR